ncbi:MAG TPA: discoidin domain-containing protein, partial [Acidimicrobiales bacterium]|nr:discoidin domain-containing protein [Acidimicrobiales bacterium]
DRWLGRPDPPISNSSGRLPGDLNARSAMALDNDPTTWWSPAIGPQEGQWLSVNLQQPITLDHWTMKVVADAQHSVPTRLRIQIDDQPGGAVVDLPPIADVAKPGATVDVPISIPSVTAQHRITVTVESVRAVQTLDQLSGKKVDLPVGIAELGVPGLVEAPAGTSVPGTCRTDLLTVDGKPVGLRVLGSTAEAARRDGLAIQPCGPGVDATGAVSLGAGPHVVRTATGRFNGIDIDRLVFGSERGGASLAAGAPPAAAPSPGAAVTVLSQGRTSAKVRVTAAPSGAPFWLVLGQSLDKGWTAHVDGGPSLGPPRRIDGYANGWLVKANPGQVLTVSLRWTPQGRVKVGLWVSAIAALLCTVLALRSVGLRGSRVPVSTLAGRLPERPSAYRPWRSPEPPLGGRRPLIVVLGSALVGGVLIGWVAGLVVGGIVAVGLGRSRRQLVPGLLAIVGVALSGAYVTQSQINHHFPLVLEWPQHFEGVRDVAWIAVVLLGIEAAIRHLQARQTRRPSSGST